MKRLFLLGFTILFYSTHFLNAQDIYYAPGIHANNLTTFSGSPKIITDELNRLTPDSLKSHPEFGVLPFNATCTDCIELLDHRTSNNRYYVKNGTNGNEFFSATSYTDLHYKNKQGLWITSDYRLKETKQEGVYDALQQLGPTHLNMLEGFTSINMMDGTEFKFNYDITIYSSNDFVTENDLQTINRTTYTVGDDGALVKNAFGGIDQQLLFDNAQIEASYILNDLSAVDTNASYFIVEDQFLLPAGYTLKKDIYEGVESKYGFWSGDLVLENENGIEMARISQPFVFDSDTSENSEPIIRENTIGFLVEQIGNSVRLKTIVLNSWITDKNRVFPIIIDPTVTGATATWTGTSGLDDSPTFCNLTLAAATPANVTLTGSTIYWEIFAKGNAGSCGPTGCKIKHLQVRICTACACSPSAAGIWGSVANFGGTWTPTLTKLDAGVVNLTSCYTPQCAPFNINYTIYFNQFSCITAGGCVNTCAYLQKFQVTIEGKTVEATALADGATAYTVLNCADQSGFLSAFTPTYGVPGYTYSWSPIGLTGSPVFVVYPMGVTVYTLTITDACGNMSTDAVTVTNNCLLLPIELLSFTGYSTTGQNHLNWETASEKNNSGFIIERSITGKDFEAIGTVAGNGTTQENKVYSFIDAHPKEGVNYYRLRQVDENEEESFSDVIALKAIENTTTSISVNYINTTNNMLQLTVVSASEGNSNLEIYDILGNLIFTNKMYVGKGANTINLQIPDIASGAYVVSFIKDAETADAKFIR